MKNMAEQSTDLLSRLVPLERIQQLVLAGDFVAAKAVAMTISAASRRRRQRRRRAGVARRSVGDSIEPPEAADFPVEFAGVHVIWQGDAAEGLPIVRLPNGSVCEPRLRFFGWSLRYSRVKIQSMRGEAYTLREWWAFLARSGRYWDEVADQDLIDWRAELHKRGGAEPPRIERKLEIVFTFYAAADEVLRNCELLRFEVPPVSVDGPITARKRGEALEWACANSIQRGHRRRPTPDANAVAAILNSLRETGEDETMRERNWLLGRTMVEAGLRRHEAARLSLYALEAALAREGVRPRERKSGERCVEAPGRFNLAVADAVTQREILGHVERLLALHRRHLSRGAIPSSACSRPSRGRRMGLQEPDDRRVEFGRSELQSTSGTVPVEKDEDGADAGRRR